MVYNVHLGKIITQHGTINEYVGNMYRNVYTVYVGLLASQIFGNLL